MPPRSATSIVAVDFLFFRNQFWQRLMVNIGIVLIITAFCFGFLKRPWQGGWRFRRRSRRGRSCSRQWLLRERARAAGRCGAGRGLVTGAEREQETSGSAGSMFQRSLVGIHPC
jgi:hypothetical protein